MFYRIIWMLFVIPSFVFSASELYTRCRHPFRCGDQSELYYPFWISGREGCGHPNFKLQCNGSVAEVSISSVKFRILQANYESGTIRLARSDYIGDLCPQYPLNAPFDENILPFAPNTDLVTIYYECYRYGDLPQFQYIGTLTCEGERESYYVTRNLSSSLHDGIEGVICDRNVSIPASGPALYRLENNGTQDNLQKALADGFELGVNQECLTCRYSGGACGYNQTQPSPGFVCYCIDEPYNRLCNSIKKANELHRLCKQPFRCGDQGGLLYPFWIPGREDCGHPDFKIQCNTSFAELSISSVKYRILQANYESGSIRLARSDYISNLCPQDPLNGPFDENVLPLAPNTELITMYYDCRQDISVFTFVAEFDCEDHNRTNYYVTKNLSSTIYDFRVFCNITVSTPASSGPSLNRFPNNRTRDNLQKALADGFELGVNQECLMCTNSGGSCGYNHTLSRFTCYHIEEPHYRKNKGLSTGAIAGTVAASGSMMAVLVAGAFLCLIIPRRKTADDPRHQNLKDLIPLKHYNYAQVKRITNSFAEIIGKGGFGTVYRGTLCDGRSVAVKVLKDSKGSNNGEDFINEVASMSKTSHVNIVDLLGFCSEGSKRAIIYEFLENGSLDQFISSNTSISMDWTALYGIALGVARGLEYLHHGCKSRIVHFDIKPQNVLLDDNFCPKVSDFGLAKLCERKGSMMSLLDTRGTIGYIAPEVFSRMYGRVSHKSDVYSYGMLVLEMIGARNKERADQTSASNASSIYFPEWIYKDLEKRDSGRPLENGISREDEEITKKMTIIGLWCIQTSPSDRPAMNRVVEMMEGSVHALQVPPRPVFQIPPAPLQESSTLSEDISVYTEYGP